MKEISLPFKLKAEAEHFWNLGLREMAMERAKLADFESLKRGGTARRRCEWSKTGRINKKRKKAKKK